MTFGFVDRRSIHLSYTRVESWLGWKDSNLRMTGSKPVALPLGDTPNLFALLGTTHSVICKGE